MSLSLKKKTPATIKCAADTKSGHRLMLRELWCSAVKKALPIGVLVAKKEMRAAEFIDENLKKWFKEKWVRFNPQGKIMGSCARGSKKEGKPKCLPQAKAHALGKKGRASAAARKRRQDPNPDRRGPAKNVATKK